MSTTQDYQAAEQLLRRPARPGELVVGDKVRPQWIDGGARFWYGVSTGAGKRFVLVDPAAGTREPAFDHARLAAALAAASGQQVDPEALPFMAIELAGNAVEFDAFGEHWRCRLDSYACERAEFTPPGNPLEVPSPDKKVAVSRRGHDLWARSLAGGREWALTTDGEPDYQYGSGPDCTSNGTLLRKFGLPHLPPQPQPAATIAACKSVGWVADNPMEQPTIATQGSQTLIACWSRWRSLPKPASRVGHGSLPCRLWSIRCVDGGG
jgi:dipeptidyl-peptidase 4